MSTPIKTATQPTNDSRRSPAAMSPFEAALRRYPSEYTLIPLHRPGDTKTVHGMVRPLGKAPLDRGWTTAKYDREQVIARCVAEKRNAGVRLSDSLLVLDIDPRSKGDLSYNLLFAEHTAQHRNWHRSGNITIA